MFAQGICAKAGGSAPPGGGGGSKSPRGGRGILIDRGGPGIPRSGELRRCQCCAGCLG